MAERLPPSARGTSLPSIPVPERLWPARAVGGRPPLGCLWDWGSGVPRAMAGPHLSALQGGVDDRHPDRGRRAQEAGGGDDGLPVGLAQRQLGGRGDGGVSGQAQAPRGEARPAPVQGLGLTGPMGTGPGRASGLGDPNPPAPSQLPPCGQHSLTVRSPVSELRRGCQGPRKPGRCHPHHPPEPQCSELGCIAPRCPASYRPPVTPLGPAPAALTTPLPRRP